jgi:hypothetical protein
MDAFFPVEAYLSYELATSVHNSFDHKQKTTEPAIASTEDTVKNCPHVMT